MIDYQVLKQVDVVCDYVLLLKYKIQNYSHHLSFNLCIIIFRLKSLFTGSDSSHAGATGGGDNDSGEDPGFDDVMRVLRNVIEQKIVSFFMQIHLYLSSSILYNTNVSSAGRTSHQYHGIQKPLLVFFRLHTTRGMST